MKLNGDVAWRRSLKVGRVMQRRKGSNAMWQSHSPCMHQVTKAHQALPPSTFSAKRFELGFALAQF